ncbi:MAG: hypothetical protein FWC10_02405 [Lentimicrobiaceae bacterium]|nr:hypothetical protein [Lentimicrobiaceae bacterium]
MKKQITHIVEKLPDVIKESVNLFIKNLDDNAQDIVGNTAGTVGILLKLFGKQAIDKYYQKKTIKKLQDYGTETYLDAARKQVAHSLKVANIHIESQVTATEIIQLYEEVVKEKEYKLHPDNLLVVFEPKYHPAIEYIKEIQIALLDRLGFPNCQIDTFKKDFNLHILKQVEECFGTDYEKHRQEIEEFIHDEAESKLLVTIIKDAKIGFDQSENLRYEKTFAQWKPTNGLQDNDSTGEDEEKIMKLENDLSLASDLIEQYFNNSEAIEKLLFIIADFGKGKSVFMRQYAAKYAKDYINTGEGFFPIYFNLREYGRYKSDEKLGVINNYLKTRFAFDISSEKNKYKKYVFLIDSLDESGDLTKSSINAVVDSIKKIQRLDEVHCRENRLIITSRPIDDGLLTHLENHDPHYINEIPQYISIYGFKKEQFNNWLSYTLRQDKRQPQPNDIPLIADIFNQIHNNDNADIASILTEGNVLSISELQRPIFAYMIYRLIINNIDLLRVGKIGIYLSFINLLSKEAKYMNDRTVKIDLKKEFEFRNILHATSALWQLERHKGNQGFLKKADICRVLDKENKGDKDTDVLVRFKDVKDIQFLSHSYFGENDNILHFQHQSFAEILLAEYYLKVFLCYALSIGNNQLECRAKLLLGVPTHQTIFFLQALIQLLKETVSEKATDEVVEKRKLLFPLFASLSTKENNTLFSSDLYYEWFKKGNFNDNTSECPPVLLEDWCIKEEQINKILQFAADIINSSETFILAKAEPKVNLFDTDALLIREKNFAGLKDIFDKGIALLIGNTIYNNTTNAKNLKLFNTDYKINFRWIFELLKYRFNDFDMFKGINMKENEAYEFFLENLYRYNLDMSYSHIKKLYIAGYSQVIFRKSILEDVAFRHFYFQPNCFDLTELKNVEFGIADGRLTSIGKISNIFLNQFNDANFHDFEFLIKKGTKAFLKKHGLIYIPHSLIIRRYKHHDPMWDLNNIIVSIRTIGSYYKKDESFYSTDLRDVLLFQDKTVEHVFYRAITENVDILKILKDENIKYKQVY